jgi:protein-S-isoprenylcysteine O-methyltransferase Ste14
MSILSTFGRLIFARRLYAGLAVALIGLEVLSPKPFLERPYLFAQMLGLVTIALGLALRAWGSGCAGTHTRSASIEAKHLVTCGPFAYVRNPIYLGSIFLGVGMSAVIGDPLAYVLTVITFCALYFGIVPAEEEHLAHTFGAEYERYREAVPRLIPRLQPWAGRTENPFRWNAARGELFIASLLVAIYLALHLEEYLDRIFFWA